MPGVLQLQRVAPRRDARAEHEADLGDAGDAVRLQAVLQLEGCHRLGGVRPPGAVRRDFLDMQVEQAHLQDFDLLALVSGAQRPGNLNWRSRGGSAVIQYLLEGVVGLTGRRQIEPNLQAAHREFVERTHLAVRYLRQVA